MFEPSSGSDSGVRHRQPLVLRRDRPVDQRDRRGQRSNLIQSLFITCMCDMFPVFTQHAPGVPKILVGNRLHLAYKRQVTTEQARVYAEKLGVTFFEASPLCNFNITESFTELARIVLMRHGMERLWRPNKGQLVIRGT